MYNKTIARITAIQGLYVSEMFMTNNIDEIIEEISREQQKTNNPNCFYKSNLIFCKKLINFAYNNKTKILDLIKPQLQSGWNIAALHKTLISIIMISISELITEPSTSNKIIISEYTKIADRMLDIKERNFVNAILDKISKHITENNHQITSKS